MKHVVKNHYFGNVLHILCTCFIMGMNEYDVCMFEKNFYIPNYPVCVQVVYGQCDGERHILWYQSSFSFGSGGKRPS